MFRSWSLAALAAATLISGSALAADIIEEPIPVEPVPIAATSGWYLRGDVGYVFKDKSRGNWDFWNWGEEDHATGKWLYRGIDDTYRFDDIKFGDAASFGGGVGFRYNEFLRGDATVDYFRAKVSGGTTCPYMIQNNEDHGYQAEPSIESCGYDMNSKADVWNIMANAYVDLPVFGPLVVPYIGAGLGAAYVDYDDLKSKEHCSTCVPDYKLYESVQPGEDDWRFATSLMAGATVDLTGALKLDAGYKYTHIAGGDAAGYDKGDSEHGATGVQTRDEGFDLHAVRVGLRYEFH